MKQKILTKFTKIPKINDDCSLCFIQNYDQTPFAIKRVYYIFKSAVGLPRGFHAHHKTKQILFCIQGSIKIILDNGKRREEVVLDQPEIGIFLDKMIWHEMHEFKTDTILLVLASRKYEADDYIREYDDFLKLSNGKKK